ncbi:serine/threonine-protein kinase 16-like [Amphibalanus amphitrite]|uniref:serine/threonine-protein kinase 16-like n=1 Tax=Amphibalanus amphitrite TaxID=1232801 RepID=UPI001C915125|nr:serine/threonine-protein kinase 16-like [Amphibalanus amphitrite]
MGCVCGKEVVTIGGKNYVIRDKIGEGGFSIVNLVEDTIYHKTFALKTLTCHSKADLKTALQEVAFHKQLHHPAILQCLGSEVTGEPDIAANVTCDVYILLPFLPGGTLHDDLLSRAAARRHLAEPEVLRLFAAVCEGVRSMHESQPPLAHRDLKTANVLLTADRQPVIMDLGSMAEARVEVETSAQARQLQDLCAERCSMPYRAPELFNVQAGDRIDERTDIWSLGCLLYALCFFKSPFDAAYERGDSVALAVLAGTVHVPEDSPYSQSLIDLIRHMLSISAVDRPFIGDVLQLTRAVASQHDDHAQLDSGRTVAT